MDAIKPDNNTGGNVWLPDARDLENPCPEVFIMMAAVA